MAALLLLAAWVSGAAALAAETMWFRGLGRGVGTSAEALAVVSAAFLGGLGVGAAIAARRAPRARSPMRVAAVCEAAAGVLVALSPAFVAVVPDLHLAATRALGVAPGPSAWPAALVAVPVLLVPAAFLGAVLPFLVRGRVHQLQSAGRWTGALYAVNTLGAACGTVAAALWLLPTLGETGSLRVAGAGNLFAALLLLLADTRGSRAAAADDVEATSAPGPAPAPVPAPLPAAASAAGPTAARVPRAPAFALFASGLFALAGEVAWFRLLEPVTGVHVYGFAVLLVGVLAGTALGGVLGGAVADRVRRPDLVLAVVLVVSGVATVASIAVAGWVPTWALSAATRAVASAPADGVAAAGADALFRGRIVGALATVVPPLLAFAAAYPLAVRARARSAAGAAGEVGSVYAWNTLGNVAGSLLAGFLLVPAFGSPGTLLLLGGLGVAVGAAVWVASAGAKRAWVGALLAAPLLPLGLPEATRRAQDAAPSLPEVVALARWWSDVQVASRDDLRVFAETAVGTYPTRPGDPDGPPIRPREGVASTVGLLLEKNVVRVRQGGLSESMISPSDPDAGTETEVALALVPFLAHPAPRRALVVGHGAGWTVETLLTTSLEHVDVAEIEPAVLDQVERYRGPLLVRRAPSAHLHLTDGRLLLRAAAADGPRYDVVVSQPSHPWVPGAGHLFTTDAYRLARAALTDDGVFAQWVNIFHMTLPLFRTALASWHEVFPTGWVLVYNDEVVLVGFRGTPRLDAARWARVLGESALGVRARAAGIAGPEDLLRRLALDGFGLGAALGRDVATSTDDDPRLETGLAWTLFRDPERARRDRAAIYAFLRSGPPPDVAALVPDASVREPLLARTAMRAVDAAPTSDEAVRWASRVPFEGGADGARARGRQRLGEAGRRGATDAQRAQARAEAVRFFEAAVKRAPGDPRAAEDLLRALTDGTDAARAAAEGAAFAARFPDDGPLLAEWARARITSGDEAGAEDAFRRALAARRPRAPAGTGLRLARLLLTRDPNALVPPRDVLRADPDVEGDVEALTLLRRWELLTSELGGGDESPEAKSAAKRLDAAVRARGRRRLEAARAEVDRDRARGLEAAVDATTDLPGEPDAWRLRGWFELRSGDRAERAAAAASLRRFVARSADRDAARRTAETMLRLFGVPPDGLDAPERDE